MHMKVVVAILLIAAMLVSAHAQNRSAGSVSKGDGVPNWDMTASCRAAAEVAFAGQTGVREKSCFENNFYSYTHDSNCILVDVLPFLKVLSAISIAMVTGFIYIFKPDYEFIYRLLHIQNSFCL